MDKSIFLVLLVLYNMTPLVQSHDAITCGDNDVLTPISYGNNDDLHYIPYVSENGVWRCDAISCYLKCNPGYASLFTSTTCRNEAWTDLDKMECIPSVFLLLGYEGAQLYHPSIHNIAYSNPLSKLGLAGFIHQTTFQHNGRVYMCYGGLCKSLSLTDQSGQWKIHKKKINHHHHERHFHQTVVIQNKVYFIGELVDGGREEEAENVWTTLPLQNEPIFTPVPNLPYRGDDPCVVKISKDSFVITGGANSKIVTKYNITEKRSIALPQLQEGRFSHGCILVEEAGKQWIVVTGGYGSHNQTERLDLNGGTQWESLGTLNVRRVGHGMIQTDKGIFVIGGFQPGNDDLKSAEILDWSNKIWKTYEHNLKSGIAFFGQPLEVPISILVSNFGISYERALYH